MTWRRVPPSCPFLTVGDMICIFHLQIWPDILLGFYVGTPTDSIPSLPLQRRNNERDGFSNHRRLECLLIRLCMNWPKKTSKLRVSGLCNGNSPVTGWFPHKGTVTRKSFHLMTSPWAKLPMKMINFHGVFGLFEPFIVGGEFQFWHIYFIALLIDIWYSPYDLSSSMWFIYDILSDYDKLMVTGCTPFNILRPRQNCRHFP